MKDMINADASDDTLKAFLEVFSGSKGPQTMEDLSAYMKKKIGAWGITGEYQAGAVIRELQGVYVHSILSGPKTAGRAMLGTFNVAIMRPLSQMTGALYLLEIWLQFVLMLLHYMGSLKLSLRHLMSLNLEAVLICQVT